jgi:hypothetical protein
MDIEIGGDKKKKKHRKRDDSSSDDELAQVSAKYKKTRAGLKLKKT